MLPKCTKLCFASLVLLHPGIGVSLVPVLPDPVQGDGVADGLVLLLIVAGLPLLPGHALYLTVFLNL